MSKKKERKHVTVDVMQVTTTGDYMLTMTVPGWFVSVHITQDEAEHVSRNLEIEIERKAVH